MQDTNPSVERAPKVGRKEKQPFQRAGLNMLPVADTYERGKQVLGVILLSDPMAMSSHSYAPTAAPLPLLLPYADSRVSLAA